MKAKYLTILCLSSLTFGCSLSELDQSVNPAFSNPSLDSSLFQTPSSDETSEVSPSPSYESEESESLLPSSENEEHSSPKIEVKEVKDLYSRCNISGKLRKEEDGFHVTAISNLGDLEWNPEWEPEYADIKLQNVRFEFVCSVPFNGESWGIPENGQEKWAFEVGLEYTVSLRVIFNTDGTDLTYCSPIGFGDGSLSLSEGAPATIEDGKRIEAHGEGAFTLSLSCYGETIAQSIEAREHLYDYDGYHTFSAVCSIGASLCYFSPDQTDFRFGDRIVMGTGLIFDGPQMNLFINQISFNTKATQEELYGGKYEQFYSECFAGSFPPFDCLVECNIVSEVR